MSTLTPYKHDDLAIILECAKSHLNTITFIRTQAQAFINKQSGDLYLTIDAIEAGDIASKPVNTKAFTILQNASQLVNDAHSVESDIRLRLAILSVGVTAVNATLRFKGINVTIHPRHTYWMHGHINSAVF